LVEGFIGAREDDIFVEFVAVESEAECCVGQVGAFFVVDVRGALLGCAAVCGAVR
jgi:hypothetical protein